MAETKSTRERDLEEVRAVREANERRARTHDRTEIHEQVPGLGKDKPMEVHAHGGVVYVNTHGEIRFDQEGVINAQKAFAKAFQAVS